MLPSSAFDLIIGGPPCQDYSKVNAFQKGTTGKQGTYMLDFLKLIRDVERMQQQESS